MTANNSLEIKILARNLAKEALEQARAEMQEMGEAAKAAGEKGAAAKSNFDKLADGLKALGAAAIAQKVAETAVELGKLGLTAEAVQEKFVAMAGGSQQAASYLSALQAATGNTIDRTALMAEATKMLGMGLASSTAEAAELATMAVRLGDAEDGARERIAKFDTLLANQSVEVLDTYNISSAKVRARILELQEATAGLSREEAFKIAVMEEGRKALEQLGGAGLGQAQSIDKLEASWNNFKTTLGQSAAPALADAADFATGLITTTEKLYKMTDLARERYGYFGGTLTAFGTLLGFNTRLMQDAAFQNAALSAGAAALEQDYRDVGTSARALAGDTEILSEALEVNRGSVEAMGEASKRTYDDLKTAIAGNLGKELDSFADKQAEANAKVADLAAQIGVLEGKRYLTTAQKEELAGLREELVEASAAAEENALKHEDATKRIIFGFMEQRLAMDGLTQAELMALQDVASQWGLIDDATYTAIKAIDAVATSFEAGKTPAEDYGATLGKVGDLLRNLPTEHTFTLNWRETGARPNIPGKGEPNIAFASGGTMPRSGWALVGEQGPELRWLPGGSRVFNAQETERMLQGASAGAQVNAPVTIYATVASDIDVAALAQRVSQEIGRRVADRRL